MAEAVREATPAATAPASPAAEAGERGPRGAALWASMADTELGPMQRVLLDQLCRSVDRLDRLEAVLERKETWLRFDAADGGEVVVIVDGVLAEIRQQETTAKALVAEIRAGLPKATGQPAKPPAPKGGLSDLTARIQRRQAASR